MRHREDIDPANTWVVSDTHFGHENIVGYCSRPEDHDLLMLEQWRAHVPDDATVLHLGDLCWKSNAYFKHMIAKRLSGERKLLILGNHDKGRPSWYKDCGFQVIKPFYMDWRLPDGLAPHEWSSYQIEFDHYPAPGNVLFDRIWRLHGHIHNNGYYDGRRGRGDAGGTVGDVLVPFLRNHINLSVEQTRYRPVNLELLLNAAILGRLP